MNNSIAIKACGHPCNDYPYCACIPDIEKYLEEVEEEDAFFTQYSRTCQDCGGEITESSSSCVCDIELGECCLCGKDTGDDDVHYCEACCKEYDASYIAPKGKIKRFFQNRLYDLEYYYLTIF